jgi:hypothetical protein
MSIIKRKQQQQTKPIQQEPAVVFHTIHTLMLDKFLDAVCDNNFSGLVKEGTPSAEAVHKAWEQILDEYATHAGNVDSKFLMASIKEITLLTMNITLGNTLLKLMFTSPGEPWIKEAKKIGLLFKGPDTFEPDMNVAIGTVKNWEVKLLQAEKELNDYFKGLGPSVKLTRDHFNDMIAELSKFMGFSIKEEETTLSKYISILKKYRQYCNQLSKQLMKNRYGK